MARPYVLHPAWTDRGVDVVRMHWLEHAPPGELPPLASSAPFPARVFECSTCGIVRATLRIPCPDERVREVTLWGLDRDSLTWCGAPSCEPLVRPDREAVIQVD
mgnify:CR=1 FL=1